MMRIDSPQMLRSDSASQFVSPKETPHQLPLAGEGTVHVHPDQRNTYRKALQNIERAPGNTAITA